MCNCTGLAFGLIDSSLSLFIFHIDFLCVLFSERKLKVFSKLFMLPSDYVVHLV